MIFYLEFLMACPYLLVAVNDDYDYVFSENGLVAHKQGKLIGTQVPHTNSIHDWIKPPSWPGISSKIDSIDHLCW